MKKLITLLCCASLAACGGEGGSVRQTLGLNRAAPDEFKVVSRPPLSVPPEFRLIKPKPGAPPRGVASAEDRAAGLILEGGAGTQVGGFTSLDDYVAASDTSVAPVMSGSLESAGDAHFLSQAGADRIDPEIRSKLYLPEEGEAAREPSSFALEEWLGEDTSDEVIDAKAEAERIREQIDADEPINDGDVKTIERTPSTLDLLF